MRWRSGPVEKTPGNRGYGWWIRSILHFVAVYLFLKSERHTGPEVISVNAPLAVASVSEEIAWLGPAYIRTVKYPQNTVMSSNAVRRVVIDKHVFPRMPVGVRASFNSRVPRSCPWCNRKENKHESWPPLHRLPVFHNVNTNSLLSTCPIPVTPNRL